MLNKKMTIIGVYTLLLGISHPVISFNPAVDCSLEDITAVRHAVLKTPHRLTDNTTASGKIIVSVKDPGPLDQTSLDIPTEYGIQGKLPKGYIAFLERNKEQYIEEIKSAAQKNLPSTEFFFTGYGQGGQLALILSAIWCKEYGVINKGAPSNNQIKTITFSSPSSLDPDFNRSITRVLGRENIIDFSSYFNSQPIAYGIPIYTLPDEEIFDILTNFSGKNLTLGAGLALAGYFWPRFALNILGSYDSKTKAVALFSPYTFLVIGIYNIYKNHPWIPSENLTLRAFQYAQDNYQTNQEAALDEVGLPPLLSARRGLGYWVKRLLIGM